MIRLQEENIHIYLKLVLKQALCLYSLIMINKNINYTNRLYEGASKHSGNSLAYFKGFVAWWKISEHELLSSACGCG